MRRRLDRAIDSFEAFNERGFEDIGELALREIPDTVYVAGACKWVTYRSDKWNEGIHEYIHEIDSHPRVMLAYPDQCDLEADDGSLVKCTARQLPKRARDTDQVFHGFASEAMGPTCLGWSFTVGNHQFEVKAPPNTSWWWSPSGKILVAIENRRKLQLVVWGGRLDVEDRGIVG